MLNLYMHTYVMKMSNYTTNAIKFITFRGVKSIRDEKQMLYFNID